MLAHIMFLFYACFQNPRRVKGFRRRLIMTDSEDSNDETTQKSVTVGVSNPAQLDNCQHPNLEVAETNTCTVTSADTEDQTAKEIPHVVKNRTNDREVTELADVQGHLKKPLNQLDKDDLGSGSEEEIISPNRRGKKHQVIESDEDNDFDEVTADRNALVKRETSCTNELGNGAIASKTHQDTELNVTKGVDSCKMEKESPDKRNNSKSETGNEYGNNDCTEIDIDNSTSESDSQSENSDSEGLEDISCSSNSDQENVPDNDNSCTGRVRVQMLKRKREKEELFEKFRQERQRKLLKYSRTQNSETDLG